MLAAENRDLVVRLTATHRKLKLQRARSQQREALQDAKVRVHLFCCCGNLLLLLVVLQLVLLLVACACSQLTLPWLLCLQICQLKKHVESLSKANSCTVSPLVSRSLGECRSKQV